MKLKLKDCVLKPSPHQSVLFRQIDEQRAAAERAKRKQEVIVCPLPQ